MFGEEINNILYEFYKNNKSVVFASLCGSVINFAVESLVLPKLMAKLFVSIADRQTLENNVIKLIIVWIIHQSSYAFVDTMQAKIEPALTKYLTDVIIKKIFIKYQNTHKDINTTIVFSKINLIRWNIETLIEKIYLVLIPRIMMIYIMILNFFTINRKIGMCALITITAQLYTVFNNFDKCIDTAHDEIMAKDDIMEFIEDKFNNIHTITSVFNGIEIETQNCHNKSAELMGKKIAVTDCVLDKQINGYVTNTFAFSIITIYAYDLHKKGEINVEQFVTILSTLHALFNHVSEITYIFPDITAKFGVLHNNKNFISELFSHDKKTDKLDINISTGTIKFNNVYFNYNGNNKSNNIFNNYTITIKNGITMIYGKSGSGKSTFVKLICNILEPISGTITIDGNDVKTLSFECLKKNIIYVSQNTSTLFNTTICENIIYGNNKKEDVLKIIKNLMIKYELVSIFSNINKDIAIKNNIQYVAQNNFDFLDYEVGKNGELLSGGQKQIIHIIRSILNKYAKIFIYDEPTSALDINMRNNLMQMIKNELPEKTVLIITHDENIKKYCNNVISINNKQ